MVVILYENDKPLKGNFYLSYEEAETLLSILHSKKGIVYMLLRVYSTLGYKGFAKLKLISKYNADRMVQNLTLTPIKQLLAKVYFISFEK